MFLMFPVWKESFVFMLSQHQGDIIRIFLLAVLAQMTKDGRFFYDGALEL